MPLEAGDPVFGDSVHESRNGTSSVTAGDAVALSNGEMSPADSGNGDEFGGVASHDHDNGGRGNSNILCGGVVANVAAGVTEGTRLGVSATAGELAATSGGPVTALSDEGGTWHGSGNTYDVPDGFAVVYY